MSSMQSIVSDLASPDDKCILGLQKALQLAAGGTDISPLFTSIQSHCFQRTRSRTVRLLAYEALGSCNASIPQWRLIVDGAIEDLTGEDEELEISALTLLPRMPPSLIVELVLLGAIPASAFELQERSMYARSRIIGCLTTLLLFRPVIAMELEEFATEAWKIIFAALFDVDDCVAASAFKTLSTVTQALVDPNSSKLSFGCESSYTRQEMLDLPRRLIQQHLVPSFQKLLNRATLLSQDCCSVSFLPICWLAVQAEGDQFCQKRATDAISRGVLPHLCEGELGSTFAGAMAMAFLIGHPALAGAVERKIWIEESCSAFLSILRHASTESYVRRECSLQLLKLIPSMDHRPQMRIQILYAIMNWARQITKLEDRVNVLMLASTELMRVSLASPEAYINGLFALDWLVVCLGQGVDSRDREELLLSLVTGCFSLLRSADIESVDRASYVVECVLSRLRAFLYWDCSECVLGLHELFRLIDHMCEVIKSPSAIELVTQMPSTFGAIKSDKRCLRACLLVLKNVTDESVVDGVFQALETRFLSFLWANSDVDKDPGLLGSKRPEKKEPSAEIFEELLTCLCVIGVRFQSRRERIMDILSRLSDIVSDPLHAARTRALVKRVSLGALGSVGFEIGSPFVGAVPSDADSEEESMLYNRYFLCLSKFSSQFADIRSYSCKVMETHRAANAWQLLSGTSSPIMIEAYHLLNPGDQQITLFVKAGNNTMLPLENVQLECVVKGVESDSRAHHELVRIDRLYFQEVFDWQVKFNVSKIGSCSVTIIARFLDSSELFPDIRSCQDDVTDSLDAAATGGAASVSTTGEMRGGAYLPPLYSLPYLIPLVRMLVPVPVSLSEFLCFWDKAPSSETFDLSVSGVDSLEQLQEKFAFGGMFHGVYAKQTSNGHVQVAMHSTSWFGDIVQLTLVGKRVNAAWELRMEVRCSTINAVCAMAEFVREWERDAPKHGVRIVVVRDEEHATNLLRR